MCVLAFAWRAHPRWRIVLAANRDEFHARSSQPLCRWDEPDHVIAGRDLQSGGTWLGISTLGRMAVVTNLRGHGTARADRASRGALVADFLTGTGRYADPDSAALSDFNSFNLITATADRATFLTNRPESLRSDLQAGLYGLSNGRLDDPWPKTLQLKSNLLRWLTADADSIEPLFQALREERLSDTGLAPSAPSDVPAERRSSPVFIRNPVYGTRCSTVVMIDNKGKGIIFERRFSPDAETSGECSFDFIWPA